MMPVNIKSFYKNQREIAKVFCLLIDGYWNNEINEDEAFGEIKKVAKNNETKIFTEEGNFSTVLMQKCGKRRLEVISKVLKVNDKR